MKVLLIFVLGIIFYNIIAPLLGFIVEIVDAKKTLYISKLSVIVNENQIKMQQAQNEIGLSPVSAIGFNIDSTDDFDNYTEDSSNKTRRVGF